MCVAGRGVTCARSYGVDLCAMLQRVAITSARLKGLQTDLGLSGMSLLVDEPWWLTPMIDIQYDTVVAILYASYCPAQIPSNMVSNPTSMSVQ